MKGLQRGVGCPSWLVTLVIAAGIGTHSHAQMRGGAISPFTEEAQSRGLSYTSSLGFGFGRGAAFVDLDDDGDADIVACGDALGLVGVFENDGTGNFTDRTQTSGIGLFAYGSAICAADFDRDGDLDLYISENGGANGLFRNDGQFRFSNVAVAAGVADTGHAQGSCWGDFNLDGWPDLYVSNHVLEANRLFQNNGDGTFTDVATALSIQGDAPTLQSSFIDFDLDADLDIYVGNDKGASSSCFWDNHLFENQAGSFVDVTTDSGTDACTDTMSITIGDFDSNGWPDIVCTNIEPGTALMMNQGDGTFVRAEAEAGVQDAGFAGWGAAFMDFDNDGLLDLFVCLQDEPNRLYRNSGEWPCEDIADDVNVDTDGRSYVVSVADVDLDGDLDYLLENQGDPLRLFINHEGQRRNWVRLDVIGLGAERFAIGARLDARVGSTWQQRFVQAGANYKTQDELIVHFGLGEATVIDELIITWPGGTTRTLTNVPANQTWTIYPPDKCGDADGDGDRDFDDYIAFGTCYSNGSAQPWTPGCELMDCQGDFDIDIEDFDLFLIGYQGDLVDCDGNGWVDLRDILLGNAVDADEDGLIDGCIPNTAGDVNADGSVDLDDLLLVIANWGNCDDCPPACTGDANNDCQVNLTDLLEVIANWGN